MVGKKILNFMYVVYEIHMCWFRFGGPGRAKIKVQFKAENYLHLIKNFLNFLELYTKMQNFLGNHGKIINFHESLFFGY